MLGRQSIGRVTWLSISCCCTILRSFSSFPSLLGLQKESTRVSFADVRVLSQPSMTFAKFGQVNPIPTHVKTCSTGQAQSRVDRALSRFVCGIWWYGTSVSNHVQSLLVTPYGTTTTPTFKRKSQIGRTINLSLCWCSSRSAKLF